MVMGCHDTTIDSMSIEDRNQIISLITILHNLNILDKRSDGVWWLIHDLSLANIGDMRRDMQEEW